MNLQYFTCPVDLCSSTMTHRQVMCYHHWTHVPKPLQRKTMAAWRAKYKASSLFSLGMIPQPRYLALTENHHRLRDEAIKVAGESCSCGPA